MSRRIKVRERRGNVARSFTTSGPGKMPYRKSKPKVTAKRAARGPGSINAESDMRQLVMAGMYAEAAELFEKHLRIVGARAMAWGLEWYTKYKQSDVPQVREALLP